MTSPYAWYQYFVNTGDADVIKYLRWFTFLTAEELAELETATAERPHAREAQRRLAAEMTTLVHGEANTRAVELASQALFGRGGTAGPGRADPRCRPPRGSVAELAPGEPARHRRPSGSQRIVREQGCGPPHRQGRRRVGEQPADLERGLGAGTDRSAARNSGS